MKKVITVNKIQCKHCNDIIESLYHDDYKSCSCHRVAVYGGLKDLKRVFYSDKPQKDFEELSEWDLV